MGGFLPVPGQTVYGASKGAVKLLTEGLHSECAGTNVHVTAVFPGAVATNITANSGVTIPIDDATVAVQTRKTTTPESTDSYGMSVSDVRRQICIDSRASGGRFVQAGVMLSLLRKRFIGS
jgi:short-subunit dehydrogenase